MNDFAILHRLAFGQFTSDHRNITPVDYR